MRTPLRPWFLLALALVALAACDATSPPADGASRALDATSPPADVPAPADAPAPADDLGGAASTIGPAGGSLTHRGVTLTVPPGALDAPVRFHVVETADAVPAGYTAFSPVFRVEPEGTVFAVPATIALPYRGDAALASAFWSRPADAGGGFSRLGGLAEGATVRVAVTRLARAFVADGVDYTEAPDRACVRPRVLDVRRGEAGTGASAGVALVATVDDCRGLPLVGLTAADLTPTEDGALAGAAALLPTPGLQWFVTLSFDLGTSSRAALPTVIAAAEALLDALVARPLPVQVGVEVFAGQASVNAWQPHTRDLARVRERLRAIGTYALTGAATTNLHGAVAQGVARLERAEQAFEARNGGGALGLGHLVVFTDGGDTADRTAPDEAAAAARRGRNRVHLVALAGAELTPGAEASLRELAGEGLSVSPAPSTLGRDYRAVAARIAREAPRAYLLAYCSALRTGAHRVAVTVAGATTTRAEDAALDAAGFGEGCAAAGWAGACVGAQCGGPGCGACDDRTSVCNPASRQCVDVCRQMGLCGGRLIVNALGYTQTCADYGSIRACGGACTDVLTDARHCGVCGFACAAGALCRNGDCVRCPAGMVGVPGATFAMGQVGVAEPVHRVQVSGFCLDETEVTVAAYRGCTAPGCTPAGTATLCNGPVPGRDRHPINCVDWNQARAFCRARGGDLPTEAQWELAARGTDGRSFPWGNAAPAAQLCWSGVAMRDATCEVQSAPAGVSPIGAYDLAGNVAEWTLDVSAPYTATTGFPPIDPGGPADGAMRALRGGSWIDTVPMYVRAASRDAGAAGYRNVNLGFRCARFAP
jgi:formylglycine-generating enzyme required for sulfatase activity